MFGVQACGGIFYYGIIRARDIRCLTAMLYSFCGTIRQIAGEDHFDNAFKK